MADFAPLNGRPFVAEDARFAFERYRSQGPHQAYWANVGSLETPNETTLKIHMANVTADFNLRPIGAGREPLGLNLSNPKFADERIRRAMTLRSTPP